MLAPGMSLAQPGDGPPFGEKREQVESMKIAFLTRKLELTPEEAKVFWPVYDQYQDELFKLRESHRKQLQDAREDESKLSDQESEKLVDEMIVFRQKELDILKKYHVQFKKVLPVGKVARLYRAEEDFKRDLLKRLQERREGGPPLQNRKP
jgi:hypothetical protein